jgi:hypothetical protein
MCGAGHAVFFTLQCLGAPSHYSWEASQQRHVACFCSVQAGGFLLRNQGTGTALIQNFGGCVAAREDMLTAVSAGCTVRSEETPKHFCKTHLPAFQSLLGPTAGCLCTTALASVCLTGF